jgi:hypothetical protein
MNSRSRKIRRNHERISSLPAIIYTQEEGQGGEKERSREKSGDGARKMREGEEQGGKEGETSHTVSLHTVKQVLTLTACNCLKSIHRQ